MRNEGIIGRVSSAGPNVRLPIVVVVLFILSAIIAVWPMIVNRQPFLLSDSMTYIRSADAAVYKSLGSATDWTSRYHERFDRTPTAPLSRALPASGDNVIIAGRSIYYGMFLYVADRIQSLRLAAVLQSILVVTCILFTIVRFGTIPAKRAGPLLIVFTLILSLGSPLAFFTSYMEPDITCALAVLAAAHLLTRRPTLTKRFKYFWFLVLSLCVLTSSSTLLILFVIGLSAVTANLLSDSPRKSDIAILAASFVIGIAGEALFSGVVYREFNAPPVRPPFLMARLVADGPGKAFLQKHCPEVGFTLCRYLGRIESYANPGDSDTFLWSQDPSSGVFSAVDAFDRRRIAGEQTRFVIAVFEDRPLSVLESSVAAVISQSIKWRLPEFNVTPEERREFQNGLPRRVWDQQNGSLAFSHDMPVSLIETVSLPLALVSLVVAYLRVRHPRRDSDLRMFFGVLFLGIAADIVVCGAISTPHDRYLMRMAWLIPMAGLVAMIGPRGFSFDIRLPRFPRYRRESAPNILPNTATLPAER